MPVLLAVIRIPGRLLFAIVNLHFRGRTTQSGPVHLSPGVATARGGRSSDWPDSGSRSGSSGLGGAILPPVDQCMCQATCASSLSRRWKTSAVALDGV